MNFSLTKCEMWNCFLHIPSESLLQSCTTHLLKCSKSWFIFRCFIGRSLSCCCLLLPKRTWISSYHRRRHTGMISVVCCFTSLWYACCLCLVFKLLCADANIHSERCVYTLTIAFSHRPKWWDANTCSSHIFAHPFAQFITWKLDF